MGFEIGPSLSNICFRCFHVHLLPSHMAVAPKLVAIPTSTVSVSIMFPKFTPPRKLWCGTLYRTYAEMFNRQVSLTLSP